MSKIKRKFFVTYLNAGTPSSPAYERLGQDLEEFIVEMGANVEQSSNILGENSIILDRYAKTASVEPYRADEGTTLFTYLQAIVDEEKTLDDVVTDVVHVHLWEEEGSGVYEAYRESAIVEVVSYGGDTTGYQIPFNLHFVGNRTKGTFNVSTKEFTAA